MALLQSTQGAGFEGHVIQTTVTVVTSNSPTTTSQSDVRLTGHGGTVNNVLESSHVHVLVQAHCRLDSTSASTSMGTGLNLFRESTEIRGCPGHGWYHNNTVNAHPKTYLDTIIISHMDTAPATGTNNYYIGHSVYDAGHYSTIVSSDIPFSITLMEIHR